MSENQESLKDVFFSTVRNQFMKALNDGVDGEMAPVARRIEQIEEREDTLDDREQELDRREARLERREEAFQTMYGQFRTSLRELDEQMREMVDEDEAMEPITLGEALNLAGNGEPEQVELSGDGYPLELVGASDIPFVDPNEMMPRERQVFAYLQEWCDRNEGKCDLTTRQLVAHMDHNVPKGTITSALTTMKRQDWLDTERIDVPGRPRGRRITLKRRLRNPHIFIENARNS